MRLLIINHIENAIESLRNTRTRTGLTVLGVTIGVASITVILSLSGGATKVITDQVEELGGNIAVIRPGTALQPNRIDDITSPMNNAYAASNLTDTDIKRIQTLPDVEAVAPMMLISGSVRADYTAPANTPIVATTPDLISITNFPIHDGQFIDEITNQDTAVVGSQLSIDLFGTDQSIGKTFKIRGKSFTVIGVLKPLKRPINYNNVDFDHAAIINLDSGKAFNQNTVQLQQIDVKATTKEKLPSVLSSIKKTLDETHHGERDYTLLTGDDLSKPTSQFFYAVAATMTVVAAISLVVGGIGIMNILLVSVAERTREIGIRKALGASNGHITAQFMIESLAMSVAGGFAGYVSGYLIAFIISRSFLTFDPLFSWQIAAMTFGVSIVVGTLFGLYPALRASRKDPIEALRQYH
jgi:putative ABC transport system permease protein